MAAAECMLVCGKLFDHMTRHCNRSRESVVIERLARLLAYRTYDWCLIWFNVRDEVTTNPIIWGGLRDASRLRHLSQCLLIVAWLANSLAGRIDIWLPTA